MGIIMKNKVCYSNGGNTTIQPVIYSDTEREVGVWRDGKPLYQKTVYYAGGSYGNVSFNHGIADIDMPVKIEGVAADSEMANTYQLIPRSDNANNIIMTAQVSRTQITYAVSQAFSSRVINIYFTVWYTKTTDTPGSGTWTPSGVPAVHYSTDEQIIGTWVDGSTLYQRTFELNNLSGTSYAFGLSSYGVDFVSKVECLIQLGEQGPYQWITSPYIESSAYRADCHWQEGGNEIQIKSNWELTAAIVTIQYIKSTT